MADDPDLWRRYVGEPKVENLLFTRDDVEYPARSRLWPELIQNAKDRKVREWAAQLRALARRAIRADPAVRSRHLRPAARRDRAGDWRQIWSLRRAKKYASKTLPPDLAATVPDAARRVECLEPA